MEYNYKVTCKGLVEEIEMYISAKNAKEARAAVDYEVVSARRVKRFFENIIHFRTLEKSGVSFKKIFVESKIANYKVSDETAALFCGVPKEYIFKIESRLLENYSLKTK